MTYCVIASVNDEHGLIEAVTDVWPNPCSFVAVLVDGYEDVYWNSDEWKEEPSLVMGAIMGAIKAVVDGVYTPNRDQETRKALGKFTPST